MRNRADTHSYIHHSLEFSTNYWPVDRRCEEDWYGLNETRNEAILDWQQSEPQPTPQRGTARTPPVPIGTPRSRAPAAAWRNPRRGRQVAALHQSTQWAVAHCRHAFPASAPALGSDPVMYVWMSVPNPAHVPVPVLPQMWMLNWMWM